MKLLNLAVLLFTTGVLACAQVSFSADFANCTEFAGVGPVAFANASALVPAPLQTLKIGTTGAIVVRATSCTSAKINNGPSMATNISQIGVEVVPPDNTGDINNYTIVYVTNNPSLVFAFILAGVPALYDPTLTYQFTYDATGKAGELYVEVESLGLPAYFLSGTETDPTGAPEDFKANWWTVCGGKLIKQAGDYPNIAFGTAAVSFHTDKNSVLGKLIGGNTDSNFDILPLRGVYPAAHLQVAPLH